MAVELGNDSTCNSSSEYKHTTYAVVYSLVFIFGLLGNGSALYVFCKLSIKNRLSTIILINLAVSDLIFILALPLRIGYYMRELWSQSGGGGSGSGGSTGLRPHTEREVDVLDLACRVSTYLFYISMYCSIYFLMALSVCRYLVLSGRLRHQNRVYCRRVRLLCAGIWTFVVTINVAYVAAMDGFRVKASGCFEPSGVDTWNFLYRVNTLTVVVGLSLPLVLVLACYALMIRHILAARAGRRMRDVVLICLVLTVFCLCFLPYHVQRTLHLAYSREPAPCESRVQLERSVVATLCLAVANSVLDPLIFLFVGNGFLQAVRKTLAAAVTGGHWPWGKGNGFSSSSRGTTSSPTPSSPHAQQLLVFVQPPSPKQDRGDDGDSTAL
ncbi:cysteinyl leukotriene receptor 1-like [Alosa sapidissima]|uniref:cysteinyl leukotriene receptor 1-like n=1 Tax=Alosa sapidissima TaxID=34773 RepID=UPI001C08C351|nr:cysteinyl leukotriene receptor 1-like [Alosa sapidissima]XP_041920621.1 cysteinyl leukotriene receptor 1-like [Alosa sapidissima]